MVNDIFTSAEPPGGNFDELLARLEAQAGITPQPSHGANGNHSDSLPDGFERVGASVFDGLAELMTWADILEPLGWQQVRPPDAATAEAWKRPGGTHPVSAKVLKAAPYALVNWSEDSGLPVGADQKLTMPRVLAHFHYSRNESALAKDLVRGQARGVPAHVNDAIRAERADRRPAIIFDTGEQINTATGEVLTPTPERPGREHTWLTLPISFYESRPELKEIREYAHRWGAPADPVLYAILARISATVPPGQRAQTGIMSPKGASLNLFVAAIGPSGSCKSSSASIAKSYFQPGVLDMLDGIGLGSGEGLAEAYMGWVEINTGELHNNGNPKTKKVRQQTRENVYIVVDEGESLTRQMERNGATVGPMLRSAADGKTLGQANAEEARNRHVDEGCYSMGILMGFQPETAAPLLRDSASGTTQRFVYCFTTADDIPDQPPEQHAPADPGYDVLWVYPGVRMAMAQTIKDEIWRDHIAHMRGAVDEDRLGARKNLTKAKLAALLTLLNDPKRQTVEQAEWNMAETMWQISCNVRDHYRAEAEAADKKKREASDAAYAMREGRAEHSRQEARDGYVPKAVIRCAKLIAKHTHDGNVTTLHGRGGASQCLASRDRQWFEEAMEYAVSVLWIKVDGDKVTVGEAAPK
jgi:hypothetical protein